MGITRFPKVIYSSNKTGGWIFAQELLRARSNTKWNKNPRDPASRSDHDLGITHSQSRRRRRIFSSQSKVETVRKEVLFYIRFLINMVGSRPYGRAGVKTKRMHWPRESAQKICTELKCSIVWYWSHTHTHTYLLTRFAHWISPCKYVRPYIGNNNTELFIGRSFTQKAHTMNIYCAQWKDILPVSKISWASKLAGGGEKPRKADPCGNIPQGAPGESLCVACCLIECELLLKATHSSTQCENSLWSKPHENYCS